METTELGDILSQGDGSHRLFKENLNNLLNADLSGYHWHPRGN